ncbi:MAG TPA: DinB family protein [Candidatus Dormibacteraeota bacterium]
MKIESPTFTADDVRAFLREQREHERDQLVRRLEAVGERLRDLAPRLLQASDEAQGDGWTAREVLAHLALVSKVYGVVGYRVAAGKVTEVDLLSYVQSRDVFGEAAAREPAQQHLDSIEADHARTLAFLRTADVEDLERGAESGIEDLRLTALDVIRLALVNHCEMHLTQLENALA